MVIKINFVDFPFDFDPEKNYFLKLLESKYKLELSDSPEILFYGNYGQKHLKYNCLKIFYSSENVRPDYRFCDFSLSFDYSVLPKNCRLPLFILHGNLEDLTRKVDLGLLKKGKTEFCNFVYSNEKGTERNEFFRLLNEYKKIDSPGKVFNNMPTGVVGERYDYITKKKFLSKYKFTIAFENESYPGYTTEKIFHPMQVGSIPVYFGNPRIGEDFNTKSFINVHDFPSFQKAVDFIIEVDKNDELYHGILKQPYFLNDQVPYEFSEDFFKTALYNIVENRNKIKPVSQKFIGKYSKIKLDLLFRLDKLKGNIRKL